MNKKLKSLLVVLLLAVITVGAIFGYNFTHKPAIEGQKTISIEIISERDDFNEINSVDTTAETLGEFIQTYEPAIWEDSEYGTYIRGFYEMKDDNDNQYWWCITVNDEASTIGADDISLEEGGKYTFTLTKGW